MTRALTAAARAVAAWATRPWLLRPPRAEAPREWPYCGEDQHLGWWTIHGGDLLQVLRRVANGEDPDAVFAEMYANSEHERP